MCGPATELSDQLRSAIDLLEARADELHESALGEELIELRLASDRIESIFSRCLLRFDATKGYSADGALSAVQWLKARCRLTAGAAVERLQVARRLAELPGANAAFALGQMGYQHAAMIAHTAQKVGSKAMAFAEAALVEAAARFDPGTFSRVARHVEHCVDPDGSLADANKAHQRRNLSLSQTLDGVFILDGLLDNEGGATLQTALNALMHPRSEDDRSPGQRRADALVELARRQLDAASLPAVRGQRPHLTITATAETLRAVPGAPAGDVHWGLPVPAETVRRFACDAALVTVLQDEEENPLAVGRALRTVSTALRRALVTRDQGCRFPGCDRPADWSDGHHIKHWADGGETDLKNLLLVCEGHHRKVHEGGWRLVFSAERVVAIPPKRPVFSEERVIGIPSRRFEGRLLQPA